MPSDRTALAPAADRLRVAIDAMDGIAGQIDSEPLAPSEIEELVSALRRLQRLTDAAIASLGALADHHARAGCGKPCEVVLASKNAADQGTVRRDLGRIRVFAELEAVARAIRDGTALPANVDCLARTLVRLTAAEVEALRHFDDRLAERIGTSGPDAFRKLVQRLVNQIRKDHGQTSAQRARAEALGTISPRRDRTGFCLHAEWETERGTAVHAAITREMRDVATELGRDHGWTPDQLGAQAIHDLILRGAAMRRNQQLQRPQVVINVLCDRDTLSTGPHDRSIIETFDGQPLSPSQLDRMCCDAVLRRLDTAPDADVQAALPVRTPTPAQRAALRTLYDGCAISGAPWSQCEIHHVVSFSESKRTVLSELVPLSRRWHHLVHDDRWRLEMDSDRTLRVFQPDGTPFGSFDPPTPANQRTLPLAA